MESLQRIRSRLRAKLTFEIGPGVDSCALRDPDIDQLRVGLRLKHFFHIQVMLEVASDDDVLLKPHGISYDLHRFEGRHRIRDHVLASQRIWDCEHKELAQGILSSISIKFASEESMCVAILGEDSSTSSTPSSLSD